MAACSLAISAFFSFGRAIAAGAEFGFFKNPSAPSAAQAGERVGEKLPQRAGVALRQQFGQRVERNALAVGAAAIGQRRFDHERIAAIHGRRPRGRDVKLARHDVVQSLEQQLFADRRDAIGRRRD